MKINEEKVNNNGVEIHILQSQPETAQTPPLLIIPGIIESAEDYLEVLKMLNNTKCIVLSLRGRGKSDSPPKAYSLEHHIHDIARVVEHLNLNEFVLMGYSRGVSYVLGYATKYPEKLKGVVIGDYPAVHTKLSDKWVDWFVSRPAWRGKTALERMERHALEEIQKESKEKLFWEDLHKIACPVLIVRGEKEGAILSKDMSEQYMQSFDKAEVVVFEESDHNIFEPNIQRFIDEINQFMKRL